MLIKEATNKEGYNNTIFIDSPYYTYDNLKKNAFYIKHYAGKIKYNATEFCHKNKDIIEKFKIINWHDAMRDYGCDKPDLRIPLKLVDISELVKDEEFKVFSEPAQKKESRVVALKVPKGNLLSQQVL